MRDLGFPGFEFDWIVDRRYVGVYLVIAALGSPSGFVMAMLLAALRGMDE